MGLENLIWESHLRQEQSPGLSYTQDPCYILPTEEQRTQGTETAFSGNSTTATSLGRTGLSTLLHSISNTLRGGRCYSPRYR